MSEHFYESEKVRIDFPDGNWVEVKQELTQADQDYILNQMAKGKENTIQMELGQLPLLERSILDWSFQKESQKVPINRENISRLRVRYRTKLLIEIDRLNREALQFVKN